MGKVVVKHSCEHAVAHYITGAEEKRSSRLAWLQGQVCVECRRRNEYREAQRFTRRHNLPPIRERDDDKRKWAEAVRMQLGNALLRSGLDRVIIFGLLSVELRADWWIERRFSDVAAVFAEAKGFYDELAAGRDFISATGLPALTGNKAQVVWAEVYRMRAVKALMAAGLASASIVGRFLPHVQAWWWLCRKDQDADEIFMSAATR